MRIIQWNCQGAFRKKHTEIFKQNPEILIISECETENKLQFEELTPRPLTILLMKNTIIIQITAR